MSKLTLVVAFIVNALLCSDSLFAVEMIVGRWLEHALAAAVKMDEQVAGEFGGWQTSDLAFDHHTNTWWSIGDQNCREAAARNPGVASHRGRYVYRLASVGPNAQAEPIPIWWQKKVPEFNTVDRSFADIGTGFIDFEGIAADPTKPNRLFACTEGKEPWLVEMHYDEAQKKVLVTRTVRISTQGNHDQVLVGQPADAKHNLVWEGIAISPNGKTIYLATERVDLPARIYTVSMEEFEKGNWQLGGGGQWAVPRVYPQPFAGAGFEGQVTGLCFAVHAGTTYLIALERNTPGKSIPASLYFIDMAAPQIPKHRFALDLRAPAVDGRQQGIRIQSASPEGVACDRNGRLVLIGDPFKSFYKSLEVGTDQAKLTNLIPLVFETSVANILK